MKINIKVFPGASREELVEKDGILKAYIKAPPDKGKANKALIALIAREYKVRKADIRIVRGLTARNKTVEITT